ncbi:MAG: alanine--tRNA ligase [Bacilli bacterium]|nr:alanine--tRNA ligase [Bacilli bacterium]
MRKMTSEEIIRTYIDFFVERGHLEVESASLIPKDDPSILWINAGVTPLKKYFDGSVVPQNRRMTSCQKCIRTNDIENVGLTARHHTFFQMLGNFSVGDYFKKEALTWAFELLTSEKYFGFPKDKLYMTIYPTDQEAYDLWVSLGVDPSHIIKLEGNYWEIGEGPSGPDSEIFYDRGEKYDKEKLGIKLLTDDIENDRYIEIWNNVFSQYNAKEGVAREEYEELPSKNIDTGMGVERMACILQDAPTNYETDLFLPIIEEIENVCGIKYQGQKEFKVIADHIRSLTFALADGATFENFGRGYVLRRILRRSVMMSRKLNINKSFMADLVDVVMNKYANIYPNLLGSKEIVKELILKEEELFHKTLISGEKRLEEIFNNNETKEISGSDAFKLYDTYGFPVELTIEYASDRGFTVNKEDFYKYMEMQKVMARNNRKVVSSMNLQNELLMNYKEESTFVGYEKLGNKTEVMNIMVDNSFVDSLTDEGYIFLKENPFYAESGGQIYDTGFLKNDECKVEVLDCLKAPNKQHLLHVKVLSGELKKGSIVLTHVMQDRREEIMKHHSATHLLQKTLQEFLGDNVHQAGSRVDDKSFRFDFTYHGRLSDNLIMELEEKVNERVQADYQTIIEYLSLEEAKKKGAMALFDDKYGDVVRVVTMGDSIELCAGTHVPNTKMIDKIAIVSLENKGADTFRIEGTTTKHINELLHQAVAPYQEEIMKILAKSKSILVEAKSQDINLSFNFDFEDKELTSYQDVVDYKNKLLALKEEMKQLEKTYRNLKTQKSTSDLTAFTTNMEVINGIKVCAAILENYDVDMIKNLADAINNKYDNCFVLLANVKNNHVNIIAKTNSDKVNCGAIVKDLSIKCKGNGGGSKTFAQGGGSDASDIASHLKAIKENLETL